MRMRVRVRVRVRVRMMMVIIIVIMMIVMMMMKKMKMTMTMTMKLTMILVYRPSQVRSWTNPTYMVQWCHSVHLGVDITRYQGTTDHGLWMVMGLGVLICLVQKD